MFFSMSENFTASQAVVHNLPTILEVIYSFLAVFQTLEIEFTFKEFPRSSQKNVQENLQFPNCKFLHTSIWLAVLTYACDSISSVSLDTGASEATRNVGTGSISVAVISAISSTLIDI